MDLLDVLVDDHREIERLFRALENAPPAGPRRRRLLAPLIVGLVGHLVAEEDLLYPAVRRRLPGGNRDADHGLGAHVLAEELMRGLDHRDTADPEFDVLLGRLIAQTRNHMREEEHDVFPRVRAACTGADLRHWGEVVTAVRRAQRRVHPASVVDPAARLGAADLVDLLRATATVRPAVT